MQNDIDLILERIYPLKHDSSEIKEKKNKLFLSVNDKPAWAEIAVDIQDELGIEIRNSSSAELPAHWFSFVEAKKKTDDAIFLSEGWFFVSKIAPIISGYVVKMVVERFQYENKLDQKKKLLMYPSVFFLNPKQETFPIFSTIREKLLKANNENEFICLYDFMRPSNIECPSFVNAIDVKQYHGLFGDIDIRKERIVD